MPTLGLDNVISCTNFVSFNVCFRFAFKDNSSFTISKGKHDETAKFDDESGFWGGESGFFCIFDFATKTRKHEKYTQKNAHIYDDEIGVELRNGFLGKGLK